MVILKFFVLPLVYKKSTDIKLVLETTKDVTIRSLPVVYYEC